MAAFERRWLSAKEAGIYLGLHPQTVFDLCRRGVISSVRIGGSRRIDLRKLNEFLERQIDRQDRSKR
jgi:excisionase family DNA binding protein